MKTIIKKAGNYYLYNTREKEKFLFFVKYIALNDDAYYNYSVIMNINKKGDDLKWILWII